MRILVTGGAGYVGSFAVHALLEAGHTVTVLDNLCRGYREAIPPETLITGDIADQPLLADLFESRRIEAVLHFAAFAAVGESVRDPRLYYQNNVAHSLALLETMMDHGVGKIVFSSSCAVYGSEARVPLQENSPKNPENPYAVSKLVIERMIRDFSRAYGLAFVLLRYFNAAGASIDGTRGERHDPETHLIPLALQARTGKIRKLTLFGDDYPTPDGTCVRDYVHVEDLARAHVLALDHPDCDVFNVGTGRGYSVREIIRTIEKVSGGPVPYEVSQRRTGDPAELVAHTDRIRSVLGWEPHYTEIDRIIETAWAWHGHPDRP